MSKTKTARGSFPAHSSSTTFRTLPGRTFFIALAGKSGAGKTALAQAIAAREAEFLPLTDRLVILPLDAYYLDLSHLPPTDRETMNFDDPVALDWALVTDHLKRLSKGAEVHRPVYLFDRHVRDRSKVRIPPEKLVLVEGLFALEARIDRWMGFRVFVDVADKIALSRRIRRDTLDRGRDEASVRRQFVEQVRPSFLRFVAPHKDRADLILDGQAPLAESAAEVIMRAKEKWTLRSRFRNLADG